MKQPYTQATLYGIFRRNQVSSLYVKDMSWGFQDSLKTSIWFNGQHGLVEQFGPQECEHPLAILKGYEHDNLNLLLPDFASRQIESIFYQKLDEYLAKESRNVILVDFRDTSQLSLTFAPEVELVETNYEFQIQQSFEFGGAAFPEDWPETYREGRKSRVLANRYERSDKARTRCLEIYGARCFYCLLALEEIYGDVGRGVIQVHHINPISKGVRDTNSARDLRPICPNCHVIIHREDPPLSEERMKAIILNRV